jgi:hypothetical protein
METSEIFFFNFSPRSLIIFPPRDVPPKAAEAAAAEEGVEAETKRIALNCAFHLPMHVWSSKLSIKLAA